MKDNPWILNELAYLTTQFLLCNNCLLKLILLKFISSFRRFAHLLFIFPNGNCLNNIRSAISIKQIKLIKK